MSDLLTPKELAAQLRRSERYVKFMKQRGFRMIGGMATFAEARAWLGENPPPCRRKK